MSFRYDFDMYCAEADAPQDAFAAKLANGGGQPRATEYKAMFRDPALVKALRNASTDVRAFFTDSGFLLEVYDSGAPSGQYPADHEAARTYCIERMTEMFRELPKNPERDWNAFSMVDFTRHIVKATPIEMAPRAREIEQETVAREELAIARTERVKGMDASLQLKRAVALLMLTVGSALLLVSVVGAVA